jgi:hypothetical protein
MASNYKDLRLEVALDLDNLSDEISRKLDTEQVVKFIEGLLNDICDVETDEAIFLSQLKNMIAFVEGNPEEYAATKWEMLPAMKGLLGK